MCNLEGTLKFLLPGISDDRIWLMKITGYKSIQRIQAYIQFQKELGNSLIGDYELFLNKETQVNKLGKVFNNYILDIMKSQQIISKKSIQSTQNISKELNQTNITNQNQLSTKNLQNVENKIQNSNITENISDTKNKSNITDVEEDKGTKTPKKTTRKKKEKVETEQQEMKETQNAEINNKIENNTQDENKNVLQEQTQINNADVPVAEDDEFKNQYILFSTSNKEFMKDGKPTQYLVGNFYDINNNPIDVVIPQKYAEELTKCDVGTTVILDLAKAGQNYFTNSIKYEQKILKKVAA